MGWCLQSRIVLPRQKSSISVEERWKSLHLWLSLLSHSHPCSHSLNAGSWKTLQLSCRRTRLGFLSQGFGHPQSPSLSFTFSVVSASFGIPHVASVDAWTQDEVEQKARRLFHFLNIPLDPGDQCCPTELSVMMDMVFIRIAHSDRD